MMRCAEDANYWDTTVHPAKSLGEIQEMLEGFGVTNIITTQGQIAGGGTAWLVRFQWNNRAYRFIFAPLGCRYPNKISSFNGKKRVHSEQARYQMGRIAVWFVKAILTAAEANPHALFGFLELPGAARRGSIPPTAAELDVDVLTASLPLIDLPMLEEGESDGK